MENPENKFISNSAETVKSTQQVSSIKPLKIDEIVTLELIREVFKGYNNTLEVLDFNAKPGTERGDNFLSLMYAVQVRLKRKSSQSNPNDAELIETMEIMLKCLSRNPTRLLLIKEGKYFLKECEMYNKVLPLISANNNSFKALPKCIAALYDGEKGYIAMANLKLQGYVKQLTTLI